MIKYAILLLIQLIFYSTSSELRFNFTTREFPTTSPNVVSFLNIPVSPVFYNTVKRPCIEFCIGTLPQCFYLVIHSNSFYIWVVESISTQKTDKKFEPFLSQTFVKNGTEIILKYSKKHVIAFTGKDEVTIQQQKLGRFFFALSKASDSFQNFEGMIGLGYTPTEAEEMFSFIDQLYNQNVIYHKVYAQFFSDNENGEIVFGEIPKHIVDNYQKYGRCKALDKIIDNKMYKNHNWQCSLTGVYYGNKYVDGLVKYFEKTKVTFSVYRKRSMVPLAILEYFEKSYLKEMIEQNKCRRTKVKKYDAISCDEYMSSGEEMNLVFGEWSMKIPSPELFALNSNGKYEFIFYHKENYEKWILGRQILKLFHMVYDAHNEEIGFYSVDNVLHAANSLILPPKVYEKLSDKEPKKKNDRNKPTHKKPPTLKPYEDNNDDITVPKENNPALETAYIIQILLLIFVIIVAVAFASFGIWMYIRYKKKTVFQDHSYFLQKTQELSRQ